MTQSIENAITEIANVVAATTGINAPQATPRENANEFPFAMVYLMEGEGNAESEGWTTELHSIAIDLLVPREWGIEIVFETLHPILDDLKVALWSEVAKTGGDAFNSSIDTFSVMRFQFLPEYIYNNTEMIGYRTIMEQVKLLTTL